MFSMLYEANFTYDSSMPIYENKPPSFPYTMDYQLAHDCMIPPCPNRYVEVILNAQKCQCNPTTISAEWYLLPMQYIVASAYKNF